ncbi:sensor histidine kinase [Azohydromonas lata]|uniref:sensor histidine kinase n=1 Tax=Azohydromonas lata TaxID=45677 RepID=UPI00082CFE85|nr:HAMP domain-containing sensor histidine kinase [Azohydromonas lata]
MTGRARTPAATRTRLATRITLASVLVALATVLLLGAGAGWLLYRQQQRGQQAIAMQLLSEQARRVADRLDAVRERMQQAAASSLIATALVDSAGKELYLLPYLQQLGQVGGMPVTVLFADFEGHPIAASRGARFDTAQLRWLAEAVPRGQAAASLFGSSGQAELAFITLVRYARTAQAEGALLARMRLAELVPDGRYELVSAQAGAADAARPAVPIPAHAQFAPLGLQVRLKAGAQEAPPAHDGTLALVLAMLAVALLLAAVAGRFFARRLTRDLDTLVECAGRMQSDRWADRSVRLPRARTSEIDALNQRINAMLDELEQAHRSQMEAEQARAAQALSEAASRQKSLFMTRVSHELRTPLNAILGFTDLLSHRTELDARQREWLHYIASAGQHLLALVNDLLDISRIESGALELQLGPVDVAEVLAAAARDLGTLAQRHEVAVQVDTLPPSTCVRADATRLRQVVQNLLSNAIKYNRPGGQARLRVLAAGEDVDLLVEDNGLGMDEAQLAQLFQPFNRLGRERSRVEGTGIGLALTRSLVEAMQGSLRVESRPGEGSRFTVRLPKCAAQPERAET